MTAFELSVLSDEISQDLGRASEVAAGQFGMRWRAAKPIGAGAVH